MTKKRQFKLTLFGGFHLADEQGMPIDPGPRKVKAMLAWLAINPNIEHPREKIATLFWPDSEVEVARHSLRQALASLRKAIPEPFSPLRTSKDSILLDSTLIQVDVQKFNAALAEGEIKASETITELYQGELLEGCNPRADLFDDWLENHRNHYRERATNAMCQHLTALIDGKSFKQAIPTAMRLINIDPLRESAYRGLMMAHMGLGNSALALRWYRRCEKVLSKELGVLPCLETRALHAQLLTAWDEEDNDKKLQQARIKAKKRAMKQISRGNQRVLHLADAAIEGVVDHLGGQSILLRGDSSEAMTKLIRQIIDLAEPQGFQVCRGEITAADEQSNVPSMLSMHKPNEMELASCQALTPSVSLSRQLEGCVECVQSNSAVSPLLLIMENIHFAGARTLELLGRMISSVGQSSVLLVMTSHFGGEPTDNAWKGAMVNAPLTTIDLG